MILENGNVRCWGYGPYGELGYPFVFRVGDELTTAMVGDVDVGEPVVQIALGKHHTCALLESGSVRCWGHAGSGVLGYGDRCVPSFQGDTSCDVGDDESPSAFGVVELGDEEVVQIAAGAVHTCALFANGGVKCWGFGGNGQLGYGDTEAVGDDESVGSVGFVDVGGVVTQISAGGGHTCALLYSGAVRCWGWGFQGRLGYGNCSSAGGDCNIGDDELPSAVGDVPIGARATQVVAGEKTTCAILESGSLRCWGWVFVVGSPHHLVIGDDETPESIGDVEVGGAVVQVAIGANHVCALLEQGNVRCWGEGRSGVLGYGNEETIGNDETPASAGDVDVGGMATKIAAGKYHTCVVLESGSVRCWGIGRIQCGNLGLGGEFCGSVGDDETPESVGDVPVF